MYSRSPFPISSVGTGGDRQFFSWGPVGTANFFRGDAWGPRTPLNESLCPTIKKMTCFARFMAKTRKTVFAKMPFLAHFWSFRGPVSLGS